MSKAASSIQAPERGSGRHLRRTLLILPLIATATLSHAHDTADTLEKLKQTGTIRIGHRLAEAPFSYVIDGKPTGYSTELCEQIVQRIASKLQIPSIKIEFVPVSAATRFVMMRAEKIDMECAATTNTADRRKLVAFSYPHFLTATRFVSLKKSNLERIGDLAGRSVAATTGTVNLEQLNSVNRQRGLNISVLLNKENRDAFAMVVNGKAAAFVMDDILLAGHVASVPNPDDFVISTETFSSPEPYGILLPLNDPKFKQAVNNSLKDIYGSGAIYDLYSKWFESPIPPGQQNLRMKMSVELREIFENPREYLD